MKVKIRAGVFETNSSSEHSIIIMSKEDFAKWETGEVLVSIDDCINCDTEDGEYTKGYSREEAKQRFETLPQFEDHREDEQEWTEEFIDKKEFIKSMASSMTAYTTPDDKWVIYTGEIYC